MLEQAVAAPPARPRITAPRPRNLKLLICGAVLGLALLYVLVTATRATAVYYVTPGELRAQPPGAQARVVRVGARVVDGSIQRDDRAQVLRFAVRDREGEAALPVVYRGVVPDLFGYAKDGYYQDVVIEGRYTPAGVLEASQLLVSHGALVEADQATGGGRAPARS